MIEISFVPIILLSGKNMCYNYFYWIFNLSVVKGINDFGTMDTCHCLQSGQRSLQCFAFMRGALVFVFLDLFALVFQSFRF